jgi:hypothetical protein
MNMKMRILLYATTLAAYTLSVAHSVIPHHHHSSSEEARSHEQHHEHKQSTDHHHHHEDEKDGDTGNALGHLFFFAHDTNVDFLHGGKVTDNSVKTKKVSACMLANPIDYECNLSRHLVYQPPQDENRIRYLDSCSLCLRAPPSFS